MWFTDSCFAFRRKASGLYGRTYKILTILLRASKCSFHILTCVLFPYKCWSGDCLTGLPCRRALVRNINTQMFPNSPASFNMLWPHLSSGLWFWSLPTVFKYHLTFFFSYCQTEAAHASQTLPSLFRCLPRCMSDHGDLNLAMPDQPWVALYSVLRGKKASLFFRKAQYSAFWLDSSLNNVIYYDAYRLLVSGSGCSCSAYSNSAPCAYWFKNNNKKTCRAAVFYNLLFLCLPNPILCHCGWKKKKLAKDCCLSQG